MSRATCGAARHRKKKRLFKAVRGFRGAPGKHWRLAKEALVRAGTFAYRDRRNRKRSFRRLWVTRLTAACKMRGLRYSQFFFALEQAHLELNRKVLSEIAIHSPQDFDAIVETLKEHLPRDNKEAA